MVGYGDQDDLGGSTSAYFDLATAQRVLHREGVFDSIVVKGEPDVSDDALAARIDAELPDGTEALTGKALAQESADAVNDSLGFLNVALLGFAGVALFVGSFIIWNTFSMQVAQRTRELALLRAIGATRRQVLRAILAEALLLGLVASLLGIALGVGMARGLSALMTSFGLELPTASVRVQGSTVLAGLLVGTVVTVVAAVAPARRATKVLPVEALRDSVPGAQRVSRLRFVGGVLLVGTGLTALLTALYGSAPAILIVVGVVGVVLGVTALAPLIVRPMAAAIGAPLRSRGLPGDLARQNAIRNPMRTASTAMALVIGLTLVAAVAVFAASLKASFSDLLSNGTSADLYVLTPSPSAMGFSRDVIGVVQGVDGVKVVSASGYGTAKFAGTVSDFSSSTRRRPTRCSTSGWCTAR